MLSCTTPPESVVQLYIVRIPEELCTIKPSVGSDQKLCDQRNTQGHVREIEIETGVSYTLYTVTSLYCAVPVRGGPNTGV